MKCVLKSVHLIKNIISVFHGDSLSNEDDTDIGLVKVFIYKQARKKIFLPVIIHAKIVKLAEWWCFGLRPQSCENSVEEILLSFQVEILRNFHWKISSEIFKLDPSRQKPSSFVRNENYACTVSPSCRWECMKSISLNDAEPSREGTQQNTHNIKIYADIKAAKQFFLFISFSESAETKRKHFS